MSHIVNHTIPFGIPTNAKDKRMYLVLVPFEHSTHICQEAIIVLCQMLFVSPIYTIPASCKQFCAAQIGVSPNQFNGSITYQMDSIYMIFFSPKSNNIQHKSRTFFSTKIQLNNQFHAFSMKCFYQGFKFMGWMLFLSTAVGSFWRIIVSSSISPVI